MAERILRAGVVGHPVGHSRSPLIHGHWLAKYGIDGVYEALDVSPANLAGFIRGLAGDGWRGCNVTIPHKEAAFAAIARRTGEAEAIGAANTLWIEDGELVAGNTDAYGFAANLDQQRPNWDDGDSAVVIGAGGASRAVVHALGQRGFSRIAIVNRTHARASELAARFGDGVTAHGWDELETCFSGADFAVNTTSLGMDGTDDGAIFPVEKLPSHAIATDIVYAPLVTPFLQAAAARGLATVDGLGMLLHQAAPGFERWFGVRPGVTRELRALIVADLEAHR